MSELQVILMKYDFWSRSLKLIYNDGSGAIYTSVPEIIHRNMQRCENKTAFVQKYLEYDLQFQKISLL
ncbi:KTSC domain-containing protein [Acinetobacter sp. A3.8]|uniref:KTSC domain-containing protein n=1 Tax=Acinetobacter sedimenti TaxID=2919922 RepID=A0A9X2BB46_9GAMM|nr:KTSC domain-containing protein [Acinetobacter sedimenti]MCJ8147205.1 KTSC domain-containing protein [Acinetobacter sedimenti]